VSLDCKFCDRATDHVLFGHPVCRHCAECVCAILADRSALLAQLTAISELPETAA
jgi:hypothetical protein